jgi:hypothetical protein
MRAAVQSQRNLLSRTSLAELSIFLHKEKFILFYSRVLRVVRVVGIGVGSRVLKVLGRQGGKGRVARLMASAVETEAQLAFFCLNWEPLVVRRESIVVLSAYPRIS